MKDNTLERKNSEIAHSLGCLLKKANELAAIDIKKQLDPETVQRLDQLTGSFEQNTQYLLSINPDIALSFSPSDSAETDKKDRHVQEARAINMERQCGINAKHNPHPPLPSIIAWVRANAMMHDFELFQAILEEIDPQQDSLD